MKRYRYLQINELFKNNIPFKPSTLIFPIIIDATIRKEKAGKKVERTRMFTAERENLTREALIVLVVQAIRMIQIPMCQRIKIIINSPFFLLDFYKVY